MYDWMARINSDVDSIDLDRSGSIIEESDSQIVLAMTDSLGMPREGVDYRDTWIHKLRASSSCEIIALTQRAATTDRLQNTEMLEAYNPDVVVTQLGVVDCAPRYMNRIERSLIRPLPVIKVVYKPLLKRCRLRRPRRSYVSPPEFRENLDDYYQRAATLGTDVYSIVIAPPSSLFIQANPQIEQEVVRYNEIYKTIAGQYEHVHILDPYEQITNINSIMIDHEHPNDLRHDLIHESVSSVLSNTC